MIIYLLILFILGIFQFSFLKAAVPSLNLNFVLLCATFFAFREYRQKRRLLIPWIFLIAGLIFDFYSSFIFGTYLLIFLLMGFIFQQIIKFIEEKRFLSGLIIFLIIPILYYFFVEISFLIFERKFFAINLWEILFNLLIFLVFYSLYYAFFQKEKSLY